MRSKWLGLLLFATSSARADGREVSADDGERIGAAWANRPRPEGAHLEVLTLNTWGLAYPLAWVDRRVRFPRIDRFLQDADIDVAGLQEVWHGARGLFRHEKLLAGHGKRDTGLALVSPHPVDQVEETFYSVSRGVDSLKSKGALRGRVSVPQTGDVWAFVTHMQAGGGDRNATVRARQLDELVAFVSEVDGPAIVMGDFNFDSSDRLDQESAARLLALGWSDAAADAGAPEPTHLGAGERYDRVYLRDGGPTVMRPQQVEVQPYGDKAFPILSDHQPLSVSVAVEPPARVSVGK